jgi:threonine synthase
VLAAIESVWRRHRYMLCPHTAVGAVAATSQLGAWGYDAAADGEVVLFATAHAGKFTDTVTRCLGVTVDEVYATADPPVAASLRELGTKRVCAARWDMPAEWQHDWTARLRDVVARISASRRR